MNHDLRLVPAAACGWIMAWIAVGQAIPERGLVLVAAGWVILACIWRRPVVIATALFAITMIGIGGLRAARLSTGNVADLAMKRAWVQAEVVVGAEPRLSAPRANRPPLSSGAVELVRVEARGVVITTRLPIRIMATGVAARPFAQTPPGSRLRITGTLRPAEPQEPVAALVNVHTQPTLLAPPDWLDGGINRVRQVLRDAMGHSPPEQAALVPSLVVGDTSAVSTELSEQFQATALTHLMAVSGANLTLLLAFVLVVVKWLGLRGWAVRLVSVGSIAVFVLVCRGEPSVLRAAAMGAVALAALGAGRDRAKGIRHLCVAVIVLLMIDPWLARGWGFALSVSASAGILWWSARWQEAMQAWAPAWLAEAVCIPLAAQLATQPIITALSGQISVIGVLTNALVGVFVGPATVLGLSAALAGVICLEVGKILGCLAGWTVQPIIWGAKLGASLPGASWRVSDSLVTVLAVGLGCLALVRVVDRTLRRPWTVLGLVAALAGIACWRPQPPGWPGDWEVVFCDVGQGDATVLRAGANQAVMVDVGPDNGAAAKCLASLGVRQVPLLILTHFHDDHIGGLTSVLSSVQVGEVLVSKLASPRRSAESVRTRLTRAGAAVQEAVAGQTLTIGAVTWTTIAAGQPAPSGATAMTWSAGSVAENDSSVAGIADIGGLRVMLPGDVEIDGQRQVLRLADQHGISLKAEILKLPHHGSSKQNEEFFRSTSARLAIASCGRKNDYGHPAARTLALASRLGMETKRIDLAGAVAVQHSGNNLLVRARGP